MSKILFFDLETAGVNALKSDLGFVICFGYKWADEDEAHCLTIDKKSLRKFSDYKLLQKASKIFEQADLVVAHYGSVFDRRYLQGRLLINNLPPIPQTKMRDTKFIASSAANFSSNRLGYLAKILKLENRKLSNGWPENWMQVMQGDMEALEELKEYCIGDVLCLEELYYRLRPFDNAHTRMVEDRTKCGVCAGQIEYRGFAYLRDKKYRRFRCVECSRWGRETSCVKEAR